MGSSWRVHESEELMTRYGRNFFQKHGWGDQRYWMVTKGGFVSFFFFFNLWLFTKCVGFVSIHLWVKFFLNYKILEKSNCPTEGGMVRWESPGLVFRSSSTTSWLCHFLSVCSCTNCLSYLISLSFFLFKTVFTSLSSRKAVAIFNKPIYAKNVWDCTQRFPNSPSPLVPSSGFLDGLEPH